VPAQVPLENASSHCVDVDARNFNLEVLEASKRVPVVIDFWAPWCGPCKVLKPMLEKLAADYGGKFRLARVNSDESLDLAREFNVRSIPDVRAFRNGKQVGAFVGALPLAQLRAFIDKLIPSASEVERSRAKDLRGSGDLPAAVEALRKALELDPANDAARLDLAELLIEQKQLDEAQTLLAAVEPHIDHDERLATLKQGVAFARSGQSGPGEEVLARRISSSPDDLEARLQLANLHAGRKRYRQAMDELLEILRRKKDFREGEARRQMLAIFNLASSDPDLVSEYRRKLSSALY
jgi:putative thioredoxin